MIIGNNNVFEVGCQSHSLKVGDHNVLEARSAPLPFYHSLQLLPLKGPSLPQLPDAPPP